MVGNPNVETAPVVGWLAVGCKKADVWVVVRRRAVVRSDFAMVVWWSKVWDVDDTNEPVILRSDIFLRYKAHRNKYNYLVPTI